MFCSRKAQLRRCSRRHAVLISHHVIYAITHIVFSLSLIIILCILICTCLLLIICLNNISFFHHYNSLIKFEFRPSFLPLSAWNWILFGFWAGKNCTIKNVFFLGGKKQTNSSKIICRYFTYKKYELSFWRRSNFF